MRDILRIAVLRASESLALVTLNSTNYEGVSKITGKLRGPNCKYSRTLAAESSFKWYPPESAKNTIVHAIGDAPESAVAQVVDPCYWTPAMPFLYDLEATVSYSNGKQEEFSSSIGIKRWECGLQSFRLECKRYVLRGCLMENISTESVLAAREAETTLIVECADDSFLASAAEIGIGIGLDLQNEQGSLSEVIARVDWSPAVLFAIVSQNQFDQLPNDAWPENFPLVPCLPHDFTLDQHLEYQREAYCFDLGTKRQPLEWTSMLSRPIIAIRRGVDFSNLQEARSACDRLQAELAPEFDLAGYFVAP